MPKLGNNWDFVKNQALNMKLHNLLGDQPGLSAADEGLIWIDTTGANGLVKVYDGTSITTLTNTPATQSVAGTMSAADKLKLDGLLSSGVDTTAMHLAGNETVTGNKTFTGTVALPAGTTGLTKTTVGLSNVDNTTDVAKPVSTAQAAAIATKAATVHVHSAADVNSGVLAIAQIPTGTTGTTVAIGNDSRLFDSRVPLAHVQTASTITDFSTAADARITAQKGIANGIASLDALGDIPIAQLPIGNTGTTIPYGNDSRFSDARTPLAHNHVASAITDFSAAADLRVVAGITGKANLAGPTFTGTVTVPTPTVPGAAANKSYVDSLAAGLDVHPSVHSIVNSNSQTYVNTGGAAGRGSLTGMGLMYNAHVPVAGDRFLVMNTTTGLGDVKTGIYVVVTVGTGTNGIWERAVDADSETKLNGGGFVFIDSDATGWVLSEYGIIGGASGAPLKFEQFSASTSLLAGPGLEQVGQTLGVKIVSGRTIITGDAVDIDPAWDGQGTLTHLGYVNTGIWRSNNIEVGYGGTGASTVAAAKTNLGFMTRYAVDIGGSTLITVTHNLNTLDVVASLFEKVGGVEVFADLIHATVNTLTYGFSVAPAAASLRCVVIG